MDDHVELAGVAERAFTQHDFRLLDRRDGGRAAVSLCGGGGQGEALILFR